ERRRRQACPAAAQFAIRRWPAARPSHPSTAKPRRAQERQLRNPSMLNALRTAFLGDAGAATSSPLGWLGLSRELESPADQFASWLPYLAYLGDQQVFVNRGGLGFMLELMPQSGADERMVEVLLSLYANCPVGTGIQLHLFGSPHIRHQLLRYANM